MMSSTSITSMNGVTLISWSSEESSSPPSNGATIALLRCGHQRRMAATSVQIPRNEAQPLCRGVSKERPIGADRAGELVVDDDGGNGGEQSNGGSKQRLGNTGGKDGKICRLWLRDADETVHDPPDRAKKPDKGCGCTNGCEQAGASVHVSARGCFKAREARGDSILDAGMVGDVAGKAQLEESGVQQHRQDAALLSQAR